MIKSVVLLKKRPDLTFEAFTDYWRNQHPQVVQQLPGLRRYVQSHIMQPIQPQPAPFDGIGEAWFDDEAALHAVRKSEAFARLIADERNFLDTSVRTALLVREVAIR
ncbi:MAG: EthD domain-containing protein [Pseudomonadota bacterium]